MREKITIDVTAEDIANGIPSDDCKCPIAIAIKRVMPGTNVSVVHSDVRINGVKYRAPKRAVNFQVAFAINANQQPFTFELASA